MTTKFVRAPTIRIGAHFRPRGVKGVIGQIVGVRPFEHDPDPSPLIEAVPTAVHSQTASLSREWWVLKAGSPAVRVVATDVAVSASCRSRGSGRSVWLRADSMGQARPWP